MAADRQLAADHHLGEALGRLLARVAVGGDPAAPEHRGRMAERADLVQLVADVEDGAVLLGQAPQGLEQPLDLERGQDRRGLVHNQQLGVLQQAANDLDALALTDRKAVDVAQGVDRQAVALGDLRDAPGQRLEVAAVLDAERNVLGHGQGVEEVEVLEHHADAQPARLGRRVAAERRALPEHLAGVRLDHAVDDLHQGALAGAVLAQERVNLARGDLEVDAVVGQHARKALGDPAQLEAGRRGRGFGGRGHGFRRGGRDLRRVRKKI
jgi:hypothetical protein